MATSYEPVTLSTGVAVPLTPLARPGAQRPGWFGPRVRPLIPPLTLIVSIVVLWQVLCSIGLLKSFILPSPVEIVGALWQFRANILTALPLTISSAILGAALGDSVAIALAVLFIHSKVAEQSVFPLALAFRSIPFIALAPIIFLSLGYGLHSRILIVAFSTFFPTMVNMIRGLRSPDEEARELFHSFSANWWTVLVKLRWPASMPFLFAALRVSAGMAFLAAVIAEWMGSDIGIGFLIVSFAQQFKIAALWAAVLVATTLSLLAFFMVGWVEGRVLHWASNNDLPG